MAHNLSQLFARLIVCIIFLPAGVHAIFAQERFSTEEAQRIEAMGSPAAVFEKVVDKVKPASLRAPAVEQEEGLQLPALNRTALRLQNAGMPQPLITAWCLSSVMLLGGAAMLVGFCTRLFALPLMVIGAFQLVKVVWPTLGTMLVWKWSPTESQMAAAWLAATLLPVTLFLHGPGAPSVDALLKGKGKKGAAKSAANSG